MKQLDKQSSYAANVYTVTLKREPFLPLKADFDWPGKRIAGEISTGILSSLPFGGWRPGGFFPLRQALRKSRRAKNPLTIIAAIATPMATLERT